PADAARPDSGGRSGRHAVVLCDHGPMSSSFPSPARAAAGSARVDQPLPITAGWSIAPSELSWRFSRSSGPGGQGVNTADSRVELSVAPLELPGLSASQRARLADRLAGRLVDGVLTIAASEYRQQLRNRQAARDRLAAVLRA